MTGKHILVVQPFDPPMLLQRIQKILSDRKELATELEQITSVKHAAA